MTKNYLPPLIEITDPDNPPPGVRFLMRIIDSSVLPISKRYNSFFQQGEHLSIVRHSMVTPKNQPAYLSTRQFDAPLQILPWFVDKLDFFMKPSTQGGLPANKIATDKEQVNGEYLILTRAMDAGVPSGESGYSIYNLNRVNYSNTVHQGVTFSDSYLFQGGLLDLFKDLATKYQNGTL